MKWRGTTKRKRGIEEVWVGKKDIIDCLAIIENDDGMYIFHVYNIYEDGTLSDDLSMFEWVRTLAWAKRKCNELVSNRIEDWKWEQIE